MDTHTIGHRLIVARVVTGLRTQVDAAKVTGIHNVLLSRYETDASTPNVENLVTLAKTYGVTTDWLLGLEEAS